jgi:transposase InsO family protein
MGHRNARLTVHGRRLLVERVRIDGQPVAHVAKAMGISRQCAHRWVARFDAQGDAGLEDRSSRPHRTPTRTSTEVEQRVVEARLELRVGPDRLSDELGVPARTISRILRRYEIPYLFECDPLTGDVIRTSKATTVRYERDRPGELIHIDVKKIGRIPDGGGWKAWGRNTATATEKSKRKRVGYDYVHSAVDDYSRLAYSEIHPNEKGDTTAGFLTRAAVFFESYGIEQIDEVMTDNHWSYTRSRAFAQALDSIGARHITIRPHCPWQNGKVERFNQTLQNEWAYKKIYTSNSERTEALQPWLHTYNHHRNHGSLGRQPPISRVSPT